MKTGDIMNRTPVTVRIDQTFGEAFRILVQNRASNLPVVDAEGVYKGSFDLKDIWNILLPKAAQLDRKSLEDLSFVSTSFEKLKDLIEEASSRTVSEFVNGDDAPPLYSDSPVMQAILLLDECGETLAVIDRRTRKMVGTVFAWDILDPISKE